MYQMPKNRKPILPGQILQEEFLEPLKISQKKFAEHLGGTWTQSKLNAIIKGKMGVSEKTALDFADALGTTPQFWLNLQNRACLWEAMQEREKIEKLPVIEELDQENLG